MLCLLYLFVATFRHFFNRQGKTLKVLNESSYGVYIIHVPVVGAIALTLLNAPLASLAKYLFVTATAWLGSNLIVYRYKRLKEN